MKQIKFATMTVVLAATVLFTACKKDDAVAVNGNSSSTLDVGKAGIMFNSNTNFATSTAFNVRNTSTTDASSISNGSARLIRLAATEMSGTTMIRAALITITLPSTATTTNGNLTADLGAAGDIVADVSLTSNSGTTTGTTYDSQSGTLTITKLTATEIEGTFNTTVNGGGANTLILSGGSFAGKFP
jgi:hypothetical protein